ncbi:hypothetical protein MOY_00190 [Halomonas sp. GFAJ-1]|nr:hypothetical protein MOY_00190 [Halomonas sp. GFAJ-1]
MPSWLFYSDLTCLELTSTEKGIAYEVDGEAFEGCFVLAGDEAKGSVLIWNSLDNYKRQQGWYAGSREKRSAYRRTFMGNIYPVVEVLTDS